MTKTEESDATTCFIKTDKAAAAKNGFMHFTLKLKPL